MVFIEVLVFLGFLFFGLQIQDFIIIDILLEEGKLFQDLECFIFMERWNLNLSLFELGIKF